MQGTRVRHTAPAAQSKGPRAASRYKGPSRARLEASPTVTVATRMRTGRGPVVDLDGSWTSTGRGPRRVVDLDGSPPQPPNRHHRTAQPRAPPHLPLPLPPPQRPLRPRPPPLQSLSHIYTSPPSPDHLPIKLKTQILPHKHHLNLTPHAPPTTPSPGGSAGAPGRTAGSPARPAAPERLGHHASPRAAKSRRDLSWAGPAPPPVASITNPFPRRCADSEGLSVALSREKEGLMASRFRLRLRDPVDSPCRL